MLNFSIANFIRFHACWHAGLAPPPSFGKNSFRAATDSSSQIKRYPPFRSPRSPFNIRKCVPVFAWLKARVSSSRAYFSNSSGFTPDRSSNSRIESTPAASLFDSTARTKTAPRPTITQATTIMIRLRCIVLPWLSGLGTTNSFCESTAHPVHDAYATISLQPQGSLLLIPQKRAKPKFPLPIRLGKGQGEGFFLRANLPCCNSPFLCRIKVARFHDEIVRSM